MSNDMNTVQTYDTNLYRKIWYVTAKCEYTGDCNGECRQCMLQTFDVGTKFVKLDDFNSKRHYINLSDADAEVDRRNAWKNANIVYSAESVENGNRVTGTVLRYKDKFYIIPDADQSLITEDTDNRTMTITPIEIVWKTIRIEQSLINKLPPSESES